MYGALVFAGAHGEVVVSIDIALEAVRTGQYIVLRKDLHRHRGVAVAVLCFLVAGNAERNGKRRDALPFLPSVLLGSSLELIHSIILFLLSCVIISRVNSVKQKVISVISVIQKVIRVVSVIQKVVRVIRLIHNLLEHQFEIVINRLAFERLQFLFFHKNKVGT